MKSRTNSIHDWSQSLGNTIHHEGLPGGVADGPKTSQDVLCVLYVFKRYSMQLGDYK